MNTYPDSGSRCGCCDTGADIGSDPPENLPAQPEIKYRSRKHPHLLHSMLRRIPGYPEHANLTTRESDDPSIALLDACAMMLDVLTFYQERIVNEGFLRAATDRRSILELASTIGYELGPGKAARTLLAFEVETGSSAAVVSVMQSGRDFSASSGMKSLEEITIPAGFAVQSVPGPGEMAQTFETMGELKARGEWNVMRVKTTRAQDFGNGCTEAYFKGIDLNLKPGDLLVFIYWIIYGDIRQYPKIQRLSPRRIETVSLDVQRKVTKITWKSRLEWEAGTEPPVESTVQKDIKLLKIFTFRKKLALFGHNAPDWRVLSDDFKKMYLGLGPGAASLPDDWPGFRIIEFKNGLTRKMDDGSIICIDPQINLFYFEYYRDGFSWHWNGYLIPPESGSYRFIIFWGLNGKVNLYLGDNQNPVALSNLNSQNLFSCSKELLKGEQSSIKLESSFDPKAMEMPTVVQILLMWQRPSSKTIEIIPSKYLITEPIPEDAVIQIDGQHSDIVQRSYLLLESTDDQGQSVEELFQVEDVHEDAKTEFTLTGKTTRVTIRGNISKLLTHFNDKIRETVVYAKSEELYNSYSPETVVEAPIEKTDLIHSDCAVISSIPLEQHLNNGFANRRVIVTGLGQKGERVSEETRATYPSKNPFHMITFSPALRKCYRYEDFLIFGNVVEATHGETRREVLGNGDASLTYQTFALKDRPLCHIPATVPAGCTSTLQVRVNGVLWDEHIPSLYGAGDKDHAYMTRIADDGTVSIRFGDGVTGSRLPTGNGNVEAQYRVGGGQAGNVKAGSITTLKSRPLGLKGVTNPELGGATGGADPEEREMARENAPFTVRTLDRIVSLRDYEDFARAFTGIAKARADYVLDGEKKQWVVSINVAAAGGNHVVDRPTLIDLENAMIVSEALFASCTCTSKEPLKFGLTAQILLEEGYQWERVEKNVSDHLVNIFSFDRRSFGQNVTDDCVISAIHSVDGVKAVTVTLTDRNGNKPIPSVKSEDLLIIDPDHVFLKELRK